MTKKKNDNLIEFYTYLPINLDATCNWFQRLALLSRESSLYEVLNLTNSNKIPNDFYNFLLFKVEKHIKFNLDNGVLIEGKASFERLKSFMLNRTNVKKVIMNIPYNASNRSMSDYLKSELELLEYESDLQTYWYVDKVNSKNKINGSDSNLLIKMVRYIISVYLKKNY